MQDNQEKCKELAIRIDVYKRQSLIIAVLLAGQKRFTQILKSFFLL